MLFSVLPNKKNKAEAVPSPIMLQNKMKDTVKMSDTVKKVAYLPLIHEIMC